MVVVVVVVRHDVRRQAAPTHVRQQPERRLPALRLDIIQSYTGIMIDIYVYIYIYIYVEICIYIYIYIYVYLFIYVFLYYRCYYH